MYAFLFAFIALASSKIYFQDDFSELKGWVGSTFKPEGERGSVQLSAGKWVTDATSEQGLKTMEDARFYMYSKSFPEFSNEGKTLVLQYSVKNEQNIDCGGAYLKLHPAGLDQEHYNGDSAYNIMFGPDICGGTRRTHVILNSHGDNNLIKNDVRTESDTFTHMYTLVVKPDNTFKVLIDGEKVREGTIEEEFDILEPKKINDPSESKPADWVDSEMMDDPSDSKPAGWDDIPEKIVDPEAKKPEDWDDELDGEWEAPTISNPEYKGVWAPKRIKNPGYKGPWEHPQIDNPDYKPDDKLYLYKSFAAVGIEIWQVKSGTIFDNILVTDSEEEAEQIREQFKTRKDTESALEKAETEAAAKASEQAGPDVEEEKEEEEKEDL